MNLSNRMAISLASLILLMAFAAVPIAMAADGGPTVLSIVADRTATDADGTGAETTLVSPVSVDGSAILLVDYGNGEHQSNGTGDFRVIVTFDQSVYTTSTSTDTQEAETSASTATLVDKTDISVFGIGESGLVTSTVDVTAGSAVRIVENQAAIDTATAGGTTPPDPIYSKRTFLVPISVKGSAIDLPIAVFLRVGADMVYGKAIAEDIPKDIDAAPGLGNQQSARDRFNIFNMFPITTATGLTLGGSAAPGKYGIHQTITLTLTFATAPAEDARPTRDNIMVQNGSILADNPSTLDMMEGFSMNAAGTMWTITLIPGGGISQHFSLTVKNVEGAPFVFSRNYNIDSRPADLQITFTGTPVKGGAVFSVTIVYGVAPTTALTQDGVTVTGGTIVANTFSGSGTTYTLDVDPTDTTIGNPGTLTVRVGQDSQSFTIPAPDAPDQTTPDAPDAPTAITLTMGLTAGEYLVVTPAMIVYDDDATTTDVDERMNTDVLPMALAAAKRETQAGMPDLEELLYSGGTVDVYVNAGAGNPVADIIINEVMWALDENEVGTAGHTAHQWIELYNNSNNNAAAGSITLWFKPRAPSGAPTDKGSRTDRLSNVLRFGTITGWILGDNHGQSGNSNPESTKEFISMYRKADKRGDNDGINGAHWIESTELSHVKHRGTPGAANTRSQVVVTERKRPGARNVPKSHVIINEVYNDSNDNLDWIELRALQDTNLENWTLSYTKSDFTEHSILTFPKRTIKAGEVWLFVNTDPDDTNLARGQNLAIHADNQARGAGPHKYLIMTGNNKVEIPNYNNGTFYLILRTGKGWERWGSGDRIHDVAGPARFARKTLHNDTPLYEPHTGNPGNIWETDVWPLNGYITDKPQDHYLQTDRTFAEGKVWKRHPDGRHGWRKDGGWHTGFEGGLGYRRGFMGAGTPGYHNDVVKDKHTDLANGQVIVSELMLTTDDGRYPQWFELHNTSDNTVDLYANTDGNGPRNGWSIRVENHRSGSWDSRRKPEKLHAEVNFSSLGVRFIPPNQTILITADKVLNSGLQNSAHFPAHRVGSIWELSGNPFDMASRRDTFLNAEGGFLLEIVDGNGGVSDAVGNLDGKKPTLFDTTDVDFDDPYSWNWATDMIGNRRTSLIRLRDKDANGNNVVRPGVPDRTVEGDMTGAVLPLGTKWRGNGTVVTGQDDAGMDITQAGKYAKYAWVRASDTKLAKAKPTWYGSNLDISTPGHTTNTPLPVSLSHFRPTLENGEVVIRWTTESELDNAGFNILRSDTRDGEFRQVNEQMIQGKGTTAERSTYKWVDTTAKPGAVYYYQIEDVSLAGEHNTLTTTKLKGLISAKGKLTTQWGTLKNLR